MTIEGELVVHLAWDGQRVREVSVRSTRPRLAARMVHGRSPHAAADLLSRVYSICGAAQGVTAAAALDGASGVTAPEAIRSMRALAIRLEAVQEHCLRLGMDWPLALDEAPLADFVRSVRHALGALAAHALDFALERKAMAPRAAEGERGLALAREAASRTLYGMPIATWLAASGFADLEAWSAAGAVPPARWYARLRREARVLGAGPVPLMPPVDAAAIAAGVLPHWHGDAFAQAPVWNGAPAETGALARMQAHPLVAAALAQDGKTVATRLVARLTELALLLAADRSSIEVAGPEAFRVGATGFAYVHTARGVLIHGATMQDNAIGAYAIAAPTDWNFRSGGPFTAALAQVEATAPETVRAHSALVARALDPCVACAIEVGHA